MDDRIFPIDLLRGCAIIGMVVMNVAATGMSFPLMVTPSLSGGGAGDMLVWLSGFLLLDGKMRALFAMLFGASALLVIDRAEMDGRDGIAVQRRRLIALIAIGAAHYLLIWSGDILMMLGIGGILMLRLVAQEQIDLLKWALGLFAVQLLILLAATLPPLWIDTAAGHAAWMADIIAQEQAVHTSGYGTILLDRLVNAPLGWPWLALLTLPGLMGFMALGMAMAKGGFFTGQWEQAHYAATARRAYVAGLVPLAVIAGVLMTGPDPRWADILYFAGAFLCSIPVAIGHACLLMLFARAGEGRPLADRIAAIGRMALTNYLLASIVATSLFYGYGGALYGRIGFGGLAAIALGISGLMLIGSRMWVVRMGAGPAERLWRMLRGKGC